jgi:hypothetical protein
MSARLGTPGSQIVAAGNSTAAGRVITFSNAVALASMVAVWAATGTAGSRTVQVQIKDAAGNICLRLPLSAAITVGQTVNIVATSAVSIASFATTPIIQTVPIPFDTPIPSGGSITVVDTANIDATDQVSIACLFSY